VYNQTSFTKYAIFGLPMCVSDATFWYVITKTLSKYFELSDFELRFHQLLSWKNSSIWYPSDQKGAQKNQKTKMRKKLVERWERSSWKFE
jgi:hypothetical protein